MCNIVILLVLARLYNSIRHCLLWVEPAKSRSVPLENDARATSGKSPIVCDRRIVLGRVVFFILLSSWGWEAKFRVVCQQNLIYLTEVFEKRWTYSQHWTDKQVLYMYTHILFQADKKTFQCCKPTTKRATLQFKLQFGYTKETCAGLNKQQIHL